MLPVVHNPSRANEFRQRIGWSLGTDGVFSSWSAVKGAGSGLGEKDQGDGVAVGTGTGTAPPTYY